MMPRGKADTLQIKRRPRAPPLAAAPSPAMPWLPRMLDPDAGVGRGCCCLVRFRDGGRRCWAAENRALWVSRGRVKSRGSCLSPSDELDKNAQGRKDSPAGKEGVRCACSSQTHTS